MTVRYLLYSINVALINKYFWQVCYCNLATRSTMEEIGVLLSIIRCYNCVVPPLSCVCVCVYHMIN